MYDVAIEQFRAVVDSPSLPAKDRAYAMHNLALLYERRAGESNLPPNSSNAYILGELDQRLGLYREAMKLLNDARAERPSDGDLLRASARVRQTLDYLQKVQAWLVTAG